MIQKLHLKFFLLLATFSISSILLYAQCNLVPNPGFETKTTCPDNQDQVSYATPWISVGGSSDYYYQGCPETWTTSYFRPCSKGMTGFYTIWNPYNGVDYREYVQVKLISPLVAGTKYCVSFYVRYANNGGGYNQATDNLGAYFSTTAVKPVAPQPNNGVILVNPQVESPSGVPISSTTAWVLVSGSFVAAGGEQYATFGNFRTNANTTLSKPKTADDRSYYFIDDIVVKDCNTSCVFNAVVSPNNTTICPGQCVTVSATVTGGSGGPYTYTWNPNIGTGLGPFNVCPTSTTTYNFTAVDANGCTQTIVASTTITVGASCGPTVTTTNSATCSGGCTNITATGGGGTAPYTYAWSPGSGSGTSFNTCPTSTTTYTVVLTDKVGGTASNTAKITVTTTPNVDITAGTTTICNGSGTILTASGGGTYLWNTGATSTTISINPTGNITYTVTATSGGCTGSKSVSVTVNPIPIITINPTSICPGGNATLTATGGTDYLWNTGAITSAITVSPITTTSYSVIVTASGCSATASATVTVGSSIVPGFTGKTTICKGDNTTITTSGGGTYLWSDGSTLDNITVSPTSTASYSVTVTNGTCSGTATVQVTVVDNPTPIISGNANVCNGTSTNLTASGGTTYVWSTTETSQSITVSPSVQTTYTVIASTNGCTGVTTVVVTITAAPTPSITGMTTICAGLSSTLTASGGGTYAWSTGDLTATTTVSPITTTTYTVTVTTGCTATATVQVTVQSNLIPIITGTTAICNGTSTTLTTTGGGTYAWSDGTTNSSITVNPTTNTTYSVTVTNGLCSGTASQQITVNQNPNPVISGTTTICAGQSTTLTANAGGNYLWDTGAATAEITVSPTTSTNYTVVVITNGCAGSATAQVIVNPSPAPVITGTTSICNGQSTTLTSSTAGPYTWNTGATTNTITVTPTATTAYNVSVTVAGCTGTSNITVNVIPPVVANIVGGAICEGQTATLTASGGTNYLWNTGSTTNPLTDNPIVTTTYTVIASTGSCTNTASYIVLVSPIPTATASGSTTINYGNSASLKSSGGGTYNWIPSTGLSCSNCANPIASPTATTQYCVITTLAGCADSACVTVIVDLKCGFEGELFVPNGFSPNDDGQNDVLYVRGAGITGMFWVIYDRWGEKVFETSNPKQGWDGTYKGKLMDPAVFVYYLEVTCITGDQLKQKGNVAIIK